MSSLEFTLWKLRNEWRAEGWNEAIEHLRNAAANMHRFDLATAATWLEGLGVPMLPPPPASEEVPA